MNYSHVFSDPFHPKRVKINRTHCCFFLAAFGGLGGGGQKMSFKKKKKKTDDDEDEGPKIEAPSGPADGAGGWESEMKYALVY